MKDLKRDNGDEHVSDEFKDFYVKEGIQIQLTTSYNSQQNEVAERKNQRIVGFASAMLQDQGLQLHLWEEVCNTKIYLQN